MSSMKLRCIYFMLAYSRCIVQQVEAEEVSEAAIKKLCEVRNLDDAPDWFSCPLFLYYVVNNILVLRKTIAGISLFWAVS